MLNHLNWLHSGPTLSSLWMSDPATQWRKLISATCNRDPILSGHYPKLVTTGEGKLGEVTGKLHQIQSACPSHATFYPHLMRLKSGKHPLKISWWEMYGKEWKEFRQPHDLLPPKTPETCSQLLQVSSSLPFHFGFVCILLTHFVSAAGCCTHCSDTISAFTSLTTSPVELAAALQIQRRTTEHFRFDVCYTLLALAGETHLGRAEERGQSTRSNNRASSSVSRTHACRTWNTGALHTHINCN